MTAKDLKNALLQEAVQGKLVPQIASEGNARDLLEQIKKERGESLPLSPARKRSSATPSAGTPRNAPLPISEDEIPFDIPESWCWVHLLEILLDKPSNGISPKEVKFETKIKSLSLSATTSGIFNPNAYKYVELDESLASKYFLKKNDLLIQRSNSRDLVGTSCIYKGSDDMFIYPDLMMRIKLKCGIDVDYIDFVLKSPYVRSYYSKNASGTSESMPKINQSIVCNTLVPLPPLAEQKRIVEAIEKFMPLIEEYGKKEAVLKELNANIGTLTKKAILQEAVQGKLVPQIPTEGNAKDLLEQIKAQKAKLTKEGKIKKEKLLPEITEDEIPFDIPENWCWCRLGEIFQHNTGKTQNSSVETKNGTMRKFITTSNLYWDKFDFSKVKVMLFSDSEIERCSATKGDLLICEGGDYGRSAIWTYDYDVCFQNHIHRVRPIKKSSLYMKYFYYVIFLFRKNGMIEGRGVGIKSLSTELLHQIILPLPPLSEQKRIVAAIEQLLPLCEKLGK